MVDLTGLHMMYQDAMGRGMMYSHSPLKMLGWVVCKVAVGFLFVWLCTYLLHRWNLPPFNGSKKKR